MNKQELLKKIEELNGIPADSSEEYTRGWFNALDAVEKLISSFPDQNQVKWEYKFKTAFMSELDEMLNKYGNEGWQILSCEVPRNIEFNDRFYIVLKRPKS